MISQRRLAAIMFTDIVGYTALMGQDEHNALDLVHKNIKIQKPLVARHHGKWLKEMGDGSMAQFASALDAVNCAIEIQEAAETELNANLRIGIHLGDITIEKDEIYGDGVNIASRIESAADPGSVFISEAVYGAIKGISSIKTQFQGERKLKNVEGPVRMYKILSEEIAESNSYKFGIKYLLPGLLVLLFAAVGIWRYTDWFSGETDKTILVLPMKLHTSDSTGQGQYIARSLTDELIRSLGKINELTVINSVTAHVFEASLNPVNEARDRLANTDYFMKGSVEIVGMMVNLHIGLFDKKEIEIWSSSYQKDLMLIPELTGLIAADISEFLRIKLDPEEFTRITKLKPIDPEIYELWVRAWNQMYKMSAESFSEARIYFNEAVDRSPADARVWAMLAEGLVTMGHSDKPPVGVWQEGKAAALRALHLDSLNAEAWAALAHIKTFFEWDYDGAEYCYNKANELNPSISMNHYHYAWHLFLHDRLDEAIKEQLLAQELDPLQPEYSGWLARLYAEKGELALAMNEIDWTSGIIHGSDFVFGRKGDVFFEMEEYDSALYYYEKAQFYPKIAKTYFIKGDFDKGMEMLELVLSYPINSLHAYRRAQVYAEIDSQDRFFEYANYDPPYAFAPWLRKTITNPKIIQDPRYKKLMDKMNLPMPRGYK